MGSPVELTEPIISFTLSALAFDRLHESRRFDIDYFAVVLPQESDRRGRRYQNRDQRARRDRRVDPDANATAPCARAGGEMRASSPRAERRSPLPNARSRARYDLGWSMLGRPVLANSAKVTRLRFIACMSSVRGWSRTTLKFGVVTRLMPMPCISLMISIRCLPRRHHGSMR